MDRKTRKFPVEWKTAERFKINKVIVPQEWKLGEKTIRNTDGITDLPVRENRILDGIEHIWEMRYGDG